VIVAKTGITSKCLHVDTCSITHDEKEEWICDDCAKECLICFQMTVTRVVVYVLCIACRMDNYGVYIGILCYCISIKNYTVTLVSHSHSTFHGSSFIF